MRIDIYSDTVCPWCYLGKRRFELAVAARPQYEPQVTWRPFELNPEIPSDGVDRAGYLEARLGIEAGLAEHESRSALILRAGQDGVIAAERHAAVLGITGVPTFVFDGQYTISGAQEVGTLARILDQVADFGAARDADRDSAHDVAS